MIVIEGERFYSEEDVQTLAEVLERISKEVLTEDSLRNVDWFTYAGVPKTRDGGVL